MLSDDKIFRMEYLAANAAMGIDEFCSQLCRGLTIPGFDRLEDDEDIDRAYCYYGHLEYHVTRPVSGDLRPWLGSAPTGFNYAVLLTVDRQHPSLILRTFDFENIVPPVAQCIADFSSQTVLNYGTWLSPEKSIRKSRRFEPNLPGS